MKFGRNLPRNQVPEWAASYINYKGLKKLIKAAAEDFKAGKDVDLAGFLFALDRNLEDVDSFYNKKFSDASRRLKLLQDRYGGDFDPDDVEELMAALLELRGQLRKLQWFGEVNRRGFYKITKKVDKKVPTVCVKQAYVSSKVDPKPFATNTALFESMKLINEWLSKISDVKAPDSRSVHSVKQTGSLLTLPSGLLDTVDQAIRNDDVSILKETLMEANLEPHSIAFEKLQTSLLQRSIVSESKSCIDYFMKELNSLDELDDINQRNCLHRLIISIGRTQAKLEAKQRSQSLADASQFIQPAAHPVFSPPSNNGQEPQNIISFDLLKYVMERVKESQRGALRAKDSYGRIPLHYAAQYGLMGICELIIGYMQKWGQFSVGNGIDAPEWQDYGGLAPLHLSVIAGYWQTTKVLLDSENWEGLNRERLDLRKQVHKSGAVLTLATKSNFVKIVQLLVEAGVDINWQDETGETALHVAARFGHEGCAEILVHGNDDQKANIEIAENSFSWTPLHVAAVDGQLSIVKLLISANADLNRPDASGWTAREHAALRGHIDIAELLAKVAPFETSDSDSEDAGTTGSSPPTTSSLEERRSQVINNVRITEPVKTFGHRYLTNESMILVSLGSMDMRKTVEPVSLDRIPIAEAHSTQLDTALSVVVSAMGANGEPEIVDLPVHENISTDPITFMAVDPSKVKLLFDIVPTYSGNQKHKIGRGVALLSSIKSNVGQKRMNLQNDLTVPIIAADTLEVIGSVNFNILIITPFSHPNMEITEEQTYWKSMTSTMVIGHRGLGKNLTSNKSLQLGENTIQSFIAAANLGANYVEFDVQLTKDHVPVIYHDFLVSETGIDAPVHTLTLEQFLHVNKNTPINSRPPSPQQARELPAMARVRSDTNLRPRSLSLGFPEPESEMEERMKHTRDYKQKGYKANSRGRFIQAPFTTLEEMFMKIPEQVGFNIEMKYPMLHEGEEQEMDLYAVELNSFVDTVLTKVYDLGKKRNIIFSSFNPDICLLLSFKQPSIPILFLTDAGVDAVGDIRASSLQEAIRFATRWNLLGIVSAAAPFCNSPRLVRVVKESGLVCVSYGTLNNDPVNVQLQVKEGIDAVIVDSVLAIRKGLQERQSQAQSAKRDGSGKANGVNGVLAPQPIRATG